MKQPWLKFYPADWRQDPALRMCSLAARGMWIEMLCLMWQADPCGSLLVNGRQISPKQLAPLVGTSTKEAEALFLELGEAGVFSTDDDGTVYSRRMRKDVVKSERDKSNGNIGGSPEIRRGSVPKADRVRPYRKSDAPEKTARIFAKSNGNCFWCDVALKHDCGEDNADLFHADHLLPICDGGTNDEDNLVAACAVCNHDRARIGWPANSRRNVDAVRTKRNDPTLWEGVSVGLNSDTISDSKAQKLEARIQKERTLSVHEPTQDAVGPASKGRVTYPADFLAVWEGYPTDDLMSKKEAYHVWARLSPDRRAIVVKSLPAFRAYCASKPDYRPIHLCRYLSKDRADGFVEAAEKIEKAEAKSLTFVKQGTDAWAAWVKHRGKEPPTNKDGGWFFPSDFPPMTQEPVH